jgi:hypothetical protein
VRPGEHAGTSGDRRSGEAAGVGKRLYGARARIKQRSGIRSASDFGRCFVSVKKTDRYPAFEPLRSALLQFVEAGHANGTVQGTGLFDLTVDLVLLDQVKDELRGVAEKLEQPLAISSSEK